MPEQLTEKDLQEFHELFTLLAELTKDAKNILEVAQRLMNKGLVTTEDPCDSVWPFEDNTHVFVSALADAVWNPDKDENWKNEKDSAKGKH
jgi:hypothetical protein